ncbi:hypothetical protein GCM10027404_29850 [Arthrobacter tumbae]
MRTLHDEEKVEQEHEPQDDEGAYLEGKGQFKHKEPFRRYNGIRKSLRRILSATATPGRPSSACVLTFVARKDTPLR